MTSKAIFEYRVVFKRKPYSLYGEYKIDPKPKYKRYVKLEAAKRYIRILTSPEPWKEFGKDANELECCDGHECACGGLTVKQFHDEKYAGMSPIEFVRLEKREVGKWEAAAGKAR